MPTYEYKCTQDNSVFEIWQEVGEAAPTCPTCGAPSKKVFSPVRTIFKGSGFYLTDTRAENAPKSAASEEGAASGKPAESKPSETKTETSASVASS